MTSARFLVLASTFVLFAACGPRQPTKTVGGATTGGPAQGTPSGWCELYCKRMSECWTVVPNSEPNKPPEQVIADCHAQTNNCQVLTVTDAMCCSTQADCTNFAGCVFSAKNAPATCS